jgi:hypothetical protein
MENFELLPLLLVSGGIYFGYKLLMMIKRTAIRIALIAVGVTQLGNSIDYGSIDSSRLMTSVPSAIINNDIVLAATDVIYDLIPSK